MNDITARFLDLYNYLLKHKEVKKQSEFAERIGISSSSFTEISKGRNNVGLQAIQNTVKEFSWINSDWLLKGEGNLDIRANKNDYTPTRMSDINTDSSVKNDINVSPTNTKNVSPTVSPTHNLGLPKVITVTESDKELISLVPFKASAGYLNGYADPEYIENLPTLRMPNLDGGTHRAFEIKGNSMLPTLQNKSIVIGRWVESFDDIIDRRIYIVVTNEYKIVAKRVLNRINDRGVLVMISDNNNKKDYGNYDIYPEEVKELWYVRAKLDFEFPEPDNSILNRIDDLESKLAFLIDAYKKPNT